MFVLDFFLVDIVSFRSIEKDSGYRGEEIPVCANRIEEDSMQAAA